MTTANSGNFLSYYVVLLTVHINQQLLRTSSEECLKPKYGSYVRSQEHMKRQNA